MLCVYDGDSDVFLSEAIESILRQTILPNEIVIVVDGKINKKISSVIRRYEKNPTFKIIYLEKNGGVGHARNEGLKNCSNELVAIMDADDIMTDNRLELQYAEFMKHPSLALLGGQIVEFKNNKISDQEFIRKVPLTKKNILHYAKKASPFNNVTVMYKKSIILKVGGYPMFNRGEDYYLYSKILSKHYAVANLPDTLVYVRFDENSLRRRKTWRHTRETIMTKKAVYDLHICTLLDLIVFSLIRLIIFILPFPLMNWAYGKARKNV